MLKLNKAITDMEARSVSKNLFNHPVISVLKQNHAKAYFRRQVGKSVTITSVWLAE